VGGPVIPRWPATRRPPRLFRTAVAGDFLSMLDLGPRDREVPRVLPGNMLVDRHLTGRSVFTEDMGRSGNELLGGEEIEMMLRVRAEGHRIVYAHAAAVTHRTAAERMSWRWMWRRVQAAGQESVLHSAPLEPMPRRKTLRDRAFLALVAPPYLRGRRLARRHHQRRW